MKTLINLLIAGGGLFAVLPIVSLVLSGIVAGIAGCAVHEGFVNPCNFLGFEIGGLLYSLGVAGWYIFFTVPIGMGIAFVGLILDLVMKKVRGV